MTPTIIVDSREQTPLVFTRLPSIVQGLVTGDYGILGHDGWTVERKSIADLVASLSGERERFMKEIQRMLGYEFRRLLVIGAESDIHLGQYRSKMTPKAVIASLAAIEAKGVPLVYARTPAIAAQLVERWACYFVREKAKPFVTAAELKSIVSPLWQEERS
jgi:DNA excision repair protein ERCC-4